MPLSYFQRPSFLWLAAYLSFLCLLKAWGFFGRPLPADDPVHRTPAVCVLEGIVNGFPQTRGNIIEFVLKVRRVDGQEAVGRVLVKARRIPEGMTWADTVRVQGKLFTPFPSEVPRRGGYREWLAGQGIGSILSVKASDPFETLGHPALPVFRVLGRLRDGILEVFNRTLTKRSAALLSGIVMGEKTELPSDLMRAFRDSGAMHLLVASGSNVGFVLILAAALARLLGLSRTKSLASGLLAGAAYTVCAGADAPLLRGFLMIGMSLAGFSLSRNSGSFQGLVLSCWLLAIFDPRMVFQAGFQMSFAACLGLVAVFHAWRPPQAWPKLLRYAAGVFLASLAAQTAITPVLAFYFHQASLAALLSNVVLVPMTGVLMGGGFALAAADALSSGLSAWVAVPMEWMLRVFESVVLFFADLPWLRWEVPSPSILFLVVYYPAAFALWSVPDWRRSILWMRLAGLCALALWTAGFLTPGKVRVWFCSDRSAVTTALVEAPGSTRILVNAGAKGDGLAVALLDSGVRSVDAVALGCLDRECWAGLPALAARLRVREIWSPPGPQDEALRMLRTRLEADGTRWREVWPGEERSLDGMRFILQGGYTGWPLDRFSWRIQWEAFSAWVDLQPGRSIVENECSIMKHPAHGKAAVPRRGAGNAQAATGSEDPPEISLERMEPLLVETDGGRTRCIGLSP